MSSVVVAYSLTSADVERKVVGSRPTVLFTPVAGLIFETKNRAIFLERFFGREITAREQLSRAVILARFKVIM